MPQINPNRPNQSGRPEENKNKDQRPAGAERSGSQQPRAEDAKNREAQQRPQGQAGQAGQANRPQDQNRERE